MTWVADQHGNAAPHFAPSRGWACVVGAVRAAALTAVLFAELIAMPALAASHDTGTPHVAASRSATPMAGQMHALRADVQRLHLQMQRIEQSTDPAERQQLTQEHLVSLKGTLSKLHAMELQMIDEVNKGRIVSDGDLRNRQQLLAEQTTMLLEMLEQAIKTTGSAGK